ncbi:MAG TPA: DNA alkylation response protein, partial [Candidatus Melainabacteria bacterium]|nr:DNA alkylation response protein [Candidatus Melainabacteria bacterium]
MGKSKALRGNSTATHEVFNQVPPLADINLFLKDRFLVEALQRYDGSWGYDRLRQFGARFGSAEVLNWAHQANRHEPELKTHDRTGHRIDE